MERIKKVEIEVEDSVVNRVSCDNNTEVVIYDNDAWDFESGIVKKVYFNGSLSSIWYRYDDTDNLVRVEYLDGIQIDSWLINEGDYDRKDFEL